MPTNCVSFPPLPSATKLPPHPHAALCGAAAAASLAIPLEKIAAGRGQQRVARARQIAIYLAHVGFGLNYTHLSEAFGRDRTTVRHACFRIEDARDRLSFDRALDYLESALRLHAIHLLPAGAAQ
ncbi:MAG: chromosomal replication initiator DnaA [Methylobacteriaceae bacterium]|nr:chromosomal replication initiator DnaA [Methylobacteriaceae bacterium]